MVFLPKFIILGPHIQYSAFMNVKNIAFADDDSEEHDFLKEVINQIDPHINLHCFLNGDGLLNCLYSSDDLPDIIILDINMPRIKGPEVLQRIRNINKLKLIPVIMYSTSSTRNDILLSYELGASYYLRKVYNISLLKSNIQLLIDLIQSGKKVELNDFVI